MSKLWNVGRLISPNVHVDETTEVIENIQNYLNSNNQLTDLFDCKFKLSADLFTVYTSRSINTYEFNNIMKSFPVTYWPYFDYCKETVSIHLDGLDEVREFLESNISKPTFSCRDLIKTTCIFDFIFDMNDMSYKDVINNGYLKFFFDSKNALDDILKIIPFKFLEQIIVRDDAINIPLDIVSAMSSWYDNPFPYTEINVEEAFFKLLVYIEKVEKCIDKCTKYRQIVFDNPNNDFILEAISLCVDGERIIDDPLNAYKRGFVLYNGFRDHIKTVLPIISELGVLEYLNLNH